MYKKEAMKTKTLVELLSLSSSIYILARETHLIERINELSEKGIERVNRSLSDNQLDENGNEMELVDKIILKANEFKEELEQKVEELIVQFYKKVNIAHLDEVKALNEKLQKSETSIALLEARLNRLETKF